MVHWATGYNKSRAARLENMSCALIPTFKTSFESPQPISTTAPVVSTPTGTSPLAAAPPPSESVLPNAVTLTTSSLPSGSGSMGGDGGRDLATALPDAFLYLSGFQRTSIDISDPDQCNGWRIPLNDLAMLVWQLEYDQDDV
jgi:hypothetical protein